MAHWLVSGVNTDTVKRSAIGVVVYGQKVAYNCLYESRQRKT